MRVNEPLQASLASRNVHDRHLDALMNAPTSPRVCVADIDRAATAVAKMTLNDKIAVMDDIRTRQPNMLAALLVQQGLGVSLARMNTLAEILLVCFLAMYHARPDWPEITDDLQEAEQSRYVRTMTSATNLGGEEYEADLASYVLTHPEKPLFAFVHQRITAWLAHVAPEESDKYLMLAAVSYVNCIAHVEFPLRRPTRHPRRRRKAT